MENRVLPPIEIASRLPKPSTSKNVSTSIVCCKTISNDIAANAQPLQHALDHRLLQSIGNCNAYNLRPMDCNEFSSASNCIGEKSDNNLNIRALAINSNIETKTNRCNGQPKLPTLLTESKIAISTNCK